MILNNNKIDYVHGTIHRAGGLLKALRQACNNAHDNKILFIIEKLREAGFIISWNGIHNHFSWHRNADEQRFRFKNFVIFYVLYSNNHNIT